MTDSFVCNRRWYTTQLQKIPDGYNLSRDHYLIGETVEFGLS